VLAFSASSRDGIGVFSEFNGKNGGVLAGNRDFRSAVVASHQDGPRRAEGQDCEFQPVPE
jgi:hypothetical protein